MGLKAGIIPDDPWGNVEFMDGICEAIGEDAAKLVSDIRKTLEEDEADAQDELDKKNAAEESKGTEQADDELHDAAASSSTGAPASSPACAPASCFPGAEKQE